MANGLYNKYRQAALEGAVNMATADVRAILVDAADYTVNLATHEFLTSVPAGARVSVSAPLASKTTTDGVFGSGVITWTTVVGDPCEAMILYIHSGTDATSRLVSYHDTVASGFPVTPNGGNITFTPDTGANKLFRL